MKKLLIIALAIIIIVFILLAFLGIIDIGSLLEITGTGENSPGLPGVPPP